MQSLFLRTVLIASALATSAHAGAVSLMVGTPEAQHVTFDFAADRTAPRALTIATRQVGNPGAILKIWIDRSTQPLLEKTLTEEDCAFDDAGAQCKLFVAGDTKDYALFVQSFKAGRKVHVEVINANVMQMQEDVSLIGFTRSYNK